MTSTKTNPHGTPGTSENSLEFKKMADKIQHTNLWNDVKMHMIEVSCESGANLSNERKVYNLEDMILTISWFSKNDGKTSTFKPLKWCENAYDWSLLGIWGKLVTWKKGVQLGREKNGALLPKCALVHVTISENELNATCVWTTLHFWNECVYPFPLGNKTKV